jgi:hypothetical protein
VKKMMVTLGKYDTLVLDDGRQVLSEDLRRMLDPRTRALWGVVEKEGVVKPVMYTEQDVVWTTEKDWERRDVEV